MTYSEFAENVKCRDNEHNHKVFRDLEILYMNSDLSKEEIYEYGCKLVDNSKTAEELEFERNVNNQIDDLKAQLKIILAEEKRYLLFYEADKEELGLSPRAYNWWKEQAKWQKELARQIRNEIRGLQWVLQ